MFRKLGSSAGEVGTHSAQLCLITLSHSGHGLHAHSSWTNRTSFAAMH